MKIYNKLCRLEVSHNIDLKITSLSHLLLQMANKSLPSKIILLVCSVYSPHARPLYIFIIRSLVPHVSLVRSAGLFRASFPQSSYVVRTLGCLGNHDRCIANKNIFRRILRTFWPRIISNDKHKHRYQLR